MSDTATLERIRAHIAAVPFMQHLGAEVVAVSPGSVSLAAEIRPELLQQHGHVHAGASFAIADSAMGAAALAAMPAGREVVSVEVKINLLRPARGVRLDAVGSVVRAGRTLTVVHGTVTALDADGQARDVAVLQGTMMAVDP